MTRTEFQSDLQRLRREAGVGEENAGSFRSQDCQGCLRCMFCTGCTNCYRCTHCSRCEATTGSSHCLRCTGCHDCSHCHDCQGCTSSAYLVECASCSDCTYCTGCVGLARKEFHILNQPYSRSEYFAIIKTSLSLNKAETMEYNPIGIIHSPHKDKEQCPIQPLYADQAEGRVEVFTPFEDGLRDIESFSHLYLIYLFDRRGEMRLIRPTFLDDRPHGIFATRHPCRPNGIGLSIVSLVRREGNVLVVKGVDVLDGTPLLDIKPYIPRFDAIDSASNGWVQDTEWRRKPENRE